MFNNRLDERKEQIHELKDKYLELTKWDINIKKWKKKIGDTLRVLWDKIKWTNAQFKELPGGKESKKEAEIIFEEIIAENFPKNEEGNTLTDPGRQENSKQDKPKEILIKTHYN